MKIFVSFWICSRPMASARHENESKFRFPTPIRRLEHLQADDVRLSRRAVESVGFLKCRVARKGSAVLFFNGLVIRARREQDALNRADEWQRSYPSRNLCGAPLGVNRAANNVRGHQHPRCGVKGKHSAAEMLGGCRFLFALSSLPEWTGNLLTKGGWRGFVLSGFCFNSVRSDIPTL
jgi:hypothetical protein